MTEEGVKTELQYLLHVIAEDCRLIQKCLEGGVEYHNLELLEKHLAAYRALCTQGPGALGAETENE